jgi:hypothetical protein
VPVGKNSHSATGRKSDQPGAPAVQKRRRLAFKQKPPQSCRNRFLPIGRFVIRPSLHPRPSTRHYHTSERKTRHSVIPGINGQATTRSLHQGYIRLRDKNFQYTSILPRPGETSKSLTQLCAVASFKPAKSARNMRSNAMHSNGLLRANRHSEARQ